MLRRPRLSPSGEPKEASLNMKTEHLLIIRLSAMGDIAMTVPVIRALATQYPHIRITVLSKEFARTFFENLSPNISFMSADFKEEYKGIHGLNKLYRRLHAKHFTAVADLHDVLRSKYLRLRFRCCGYRIRYINKHRKLRRQLTRERNKIKQPIPTAFNNYADVFAALGYPIELSNNPSWNEERKQETSRSSFPAPHSPNKNIGIAPFAAHKGKIYPTEKMEEVIATLCQRHPDCHIFLFGGGANEKAVFDKWCAKFPNCINASARLGGIQQELDCMRDLNVMLSMDSANMHLASLAGTPVVSVWGATHPYGGFMGWRQSEDNAVQVNLDCRPCSIYGKKPCHRGDYACMNSIGPAQIVAQIEPFITQ